ncbi:hypothetical protein V1288_002988 [Bradyrhizobium sp. AZCC 2176]
MADRYRIIGAGMPPRAVKVRCYFRYAAISGTREFRTNA